MLKRLEFLQKYHAAKNVNIKKKRTSPLCLKVKKEKIFSSTVINKRKSRKKIKKSMTLFFKSS